MKKHRGLSEIVSVMIVIAIVLSGLGIYTGLSQQRILGDTLTVKEAIQQKDDQVSEAVKFIEMFRVTDIHDNNDIVGVFVHNYGLKNVTISNVFVNGTLDMNNISNPVYVRDLSGKSIWPNNRTIPVGYTSEIILNFTGDITLTNGINNAIIKTDSNKIIQFVNVTQ